jgi:hypothetical protein
MSSIRKRKTSSSGAVQPKSPSGPTMQPSSETLVEQVTLRIRSPPR